MTAYWLNFAKFGDPNAAGLPEWPRYTPPTESILTLDTAIGVTSAYHVAQCALLDRVTPFSFDPFDHGRKRGLFEVLP